MQMSCRDHVLDLGSKGVTGHYGSDGSAPHDRIEKYLTDAMGTGENLAFGPNDPLDALI